MTPFQRARVPQSERDAILAVLMKQWVEGVAEVRAVVSELTASKNPDVVLACLRSYFAEDDSKHLVWLNDVYQVAVYADGGSIHLSIKRIDRQPIHDWRDLQEIKNQLVGPENEAVELYPAESRRVDTANQYHLWCWKDPTKRFGFGFNTRAVTDRPFHKSVNRPLPR